MNTFTKAPIFTGNYDSATLAAERLGVLLAAACNGCDEETMDRKEIGSLLSMAQVVHEGMQQSLRNLPSIRQTPVARQGKAEEPWYWAYNGEQLLKFALETAERIPNLMNAFQDETPGRVNDDQRVLYRRLGAFAKETCDYIDRFEEITRTIPAASTNSMIFDSIQCPCGTMTALAALINSAGDGNQDMAAFENIFFKESGEVVDTIRKLLMTFGNT